MVLVPNPKEAWNGLSAGPSIVKKASTVPAGHCAFAMVPPKSVASVPVTGETAMEPRTAADAVPVAAAPIASVAPPTATSTPTRPTERVRACEVLGNMWRFLQEGAREGQGVPDG